MENTTSSVLLFYLCIKNIFQCRTYLKDVNIFSSTIIFFMYLENLKKIIEKEDNN